MKFRNNTDSFITFLSSFENIRYNVHPNNVVDVDVLDVLRAEAHGLTNLDKPAVKIVKEVPKAEVKTSKYTKEGLFKLSKEQQTDILRKLGVKKIPIFEKERVELILKSQ